MSASTIPGDPETASTVSETSDAVVSLYNSWSSSDTGSLVDLENVDDELLDCFAGLPREDTALSSQELLEQLQKRLKKEDLPPVPILRKRQRPNCVFLNYMGSRIAPPRLPPPSIDLGLAEKDALFPLYSSKAKYFEGERQEETPVQGEKRSLPQQDEPPSKVARVSLL